MRTRVIPATRGMLRATMPWLPALLTLVTLAAGGPALAQSTSVPAGTASSGPSSSAPVSARAPGGAVDLKEQPKTDTDAKLKAAILDWRDKLAKLDAAGPVVKAWLPRLHAKVDLLAREYNQDKKRYPTDCFAPQECLDYFNGELTAYLAALSAGQDPGAATKGRWQGRCIWIEKMNILGRYDLLMTRWYDPKAPCPVIVSFQDDPDDKAVRQTPYILVRCIQKGYPTGLTNVENKTRGILKDLAGDFNIDPFRVYATGFSYGGHTDLVMAWRFPHWFAAIAPVCSDLRAAKPEDKTPTYVKQIQTPTLLLHGTGDSFLNTGKIVHQYMQEAGCPVSFQTYPGGHDPNVPFRKDIGILTSFFDQHVQDPYPRTVTHIVEHPRYSRAFWADCALTKEAGGMEAIFQVRVKDGNRIELDANDQVAGLDLYLSDKLVDMTKPVTVVCGDRKLYEGSPAGKLSVKLRDGQEYARSGGDQLWRELLDIRQAAGFAGELGKKTQWPPGASTSAPAPPPQTRPGQ